MEADPLAAALRDRDQSIGAFVERDIGAPGAREKDFVSWGVCLGDMGGAMELRHLRYFIAAAEEGSLTLAAEKGCTWRSLPSVAKSLISNIRSAFR
jgi:hypothetical protein